MFTGIVEELGEVVYLADAGGDAAVLAVRGPMVTTDARHGDSIAVNGVCLTVIDNTGGVFTADLMGETLRRSSLGVLRPGSQVNLERAAAVNSRLGGHIVQGHVDTTGTLASVATEGEFAVYRWRFPVEFADLVVSKGSIAVDGVSLTIVEPDGSSFSAALIPETLRRTNLGNAHVGDRVNLEFDMIAKYVRNLVAPYLPK